MRYARVLAPVLAAFLALPAQAEKLSLNAISAYLNGLKTAEADFRQTNADGSVSTGRVLIQRPGRMRFEYAPPEQTLVLAAAGQVAIFDGKSNQPPEQYPLSKTPLNLILAKTVDLSRAKMVVGHSEVGGMTVVTAQDPAHPELGTIALSFSAGPVALRQWTVTDEGGGQTTVVLGPLATGKSYSTDTFSINAEAGKHKRPDK
ncbi:MAG: outer membrane lipoprotein carrier protein LolA [Rhodobacteraceae bacterium]|nr:outer membrane lipoprotein carrier protein LolA [Paracoccaceae bacterium]